MEYLLSIVLKKIITMKRLSSLIMITLFAYISQAQNNYQSLWKQVDSLDKASLPKSALSIVNQIETQANKDNNQPQQIKTLLYKSKYALILEEDAQLSIINEFKNKISNSDSYTKAVLENMLATLYWQYFQQNRWKFYDRTKTAQKIDKTDFRTWDLQTLFEEIHCYYQNSLSNPVPLQKTNIDEFEAIIDKSKDSINLRPTLYDILAHNALDFYKTDEHSISKPAYKFDLDSPIFLAQAKEFSQTNIVSKDTTSLQLNALKIFQKLIDFHLKNNNNQAAVDVDIERLNFVYNNSTISNKYETLIKTLDQTIKQYQGQTISGLYAFEKAKRLQELGLTYQANINTEHRWKLKEVLDICNNYINTFPKSRAAQKLEILKKQILKQSLNITSENLIPVNSYSKILIQYKNLKGLDFKIFKVNYSQILAFQKLYHKDEKREFINKLSTHKQWFSKLKIENDYQFHTTEVIIPQLENGHYIVMATTDDESDTFALKTIQVTNFAISESTDNTHYRFQIINRNNGLPIKGASVKISYKKGQDDKLFSETLTTDQYGFIKRKKENNEYLRKVSLSIEHQNERAYFGEFYLNNRSFNHTTNSTTYRAFTFTDRSIYRPGQTVFFKSIVTQTQNNNTEIVSNQKITATLYNANYQEVEILELKTNEYGSAAGNFILPINDINGQFQIAIKSDKLPLKSYTYISVEEYKRPKFDVQFNPVTDIFKVNDLVNIYGTAKSYAGSNISNAKVVYRVQRKIQFPRWGYWHRPWFNSKPQEITQGETTTDEKGNFDINFKAIPDLSVNKDNLPTFQYEISVDVTDINGETRSSTTIVNVGYHALTAKIQTERMLDKTDNKHKLSISTQNLNGKFVPAKGVVKIFKLETPNRVIRPRTWEAPDYQTIPKKEFLEKFPHEDYANESNPNNWTKGELVFESPFDTEVSKILPLGNIKKWKSGEYLITLETKDKFGQIVKDQTKTQLYSDTDKTLADHKLFSITTDKSSYQPNDKVKITIGSSAKNLSVTVFIEKNRQIISTKTIKLNNQKKTFTVPVTQNDFGGFIIHYSYAFANSFDSGNLMIAVPYPKTDLEIETTTFRDKLQPGQDETWSFKIKGPKGEKVAAELLASMYDLSLDQFKTHQWSFKPIYQPYYYSSLHKNVRLSFGINNFNIYNPQIHSSKYPIQRYSRLNWFGFYFGASPLMLRDQAVSIARDEVISESNQRSFEKIAKVNYEAEQYSEDTPKITMKGVSDEEATDMLYIIDGIPTTSIDNLDPDNILNTVLLKGSEASAYGEEGKNGVMLITTKQGLKQFSQVQTRKNLQETAFFFPQLQTDKEGNISFSFITPESLTQWKVQLLAHTKTLENAVTTLTSVTQKELMVIPNTPRFLRHGDHIVISTKISNLSDQNLSGQAQLQLIDAISGKEITNDLINSNIIKNFSVNQNENTQVSWDLTIPETISAIQYKIVAKAGDFSDGEQNALPILSNRILVTETLPMWVKNNETRTFTLDKLTNNTSKTLKHHKLTLEITSNPAWYAVQALPYLMEYPYDCNEQTFSRYYANALASHIANSNPRIKEVFVQWRNSDALISNLEKNEALKNILIQETPWLRDAQSESEQKKRIALLFDLNKMNNELQNSLRKLEQNQMNNGAWAWFKGGLENRFITQHIISGFGHLKHLKVVNLDNSSKMITKAITYLDSEFIKEYNNLNKYNKDIDLSKDHLSYSQLHYLYTRSFFPEIEQSEQAQQISTYYLSQIQKYWQKRSLYSKGLMALIAYRMGDDKTTANILKSLKENSITNNELGMYWKSNTTSWHWYQAPIETQALMVEVFSESGTVIQDQKTNTETINNLKIWLLKNKQTNKWKTTKATTEAIYALLLQGGDWLSVSEALDVVVGKQHITPSTKEEANIEAGTGYYKTSWNGSEIKPDMAKVTLTKKGDGIAWGSLYWQYFEDLDKITSAETPLKLKKKLFKKTNTDQGEELSEITSETDLKVGDLVRVRIELRSDRNMEFIHMKDMRAAGLEPVNVLSQYKWQDGLGYYESTKDASTNFFFDFLPKGIYVFEYDLRVNNSGNMSNGITTIQSMYAPEFSSHSEGIRISVEN